MIDKVKAVIDKYAMLPQGACVVAAVSGGSDSMALLYILNLLKEEYGFSLCAAHVNHGLRGENAQRDERFVESKCREAGIPVHILKADVAALASQSGMGIEECGRKVRYDFFNSLGENIIIATAHNLSDRIETFFFNFTRGSALRGLCSIPPKRDNIIRPLIDCSKDEITAFCAANSIEYVTDETNSDVKYSRNRIRHNVVTQLREINPSFEKCAGRCIESLNEDELFLSSLADELVRSARLPVGFDAAKLSNSPRPVALRALMSICAECADTVPENKAAEKIFDLLSSGGSFNINGGASVRVRKGILDFPQSFDKPEKAELTLGKVSFGGLTAETEIINIDEINKLQKISKQGLEYYLDCDKIHGKVFLRSRQDGDKIKIKARGCTKTLKKLFNEMSLPPEKRDGVAVSADESGVLFVEGVGCDARAEITPETKRVMRVRLKRNNNGV